METIRNYLDNMFSGLPKTEEMVNLKNNILENMQDKYQELKESGKSENEAIGVVISEFGNIEEILEEFDIKPEITSGETIENKAVLPEVTLETARDYIKVTKTMGNFVGIGVFLCLVGVAILIICRALTEYQLVNGNENMGNVIGLVIMFMFIVGGVALFIYSGFLVAPYEYMEKPFNSSQYVKQQLSAEWSMVRPANIVRLIIGICMCVISPVPLLLGTAISDKMTLLGTSILLLIVAIGVYLIITAGTLMEAYERLMETGDYTPQNKKVNKKIEIVSSIVWPLATAAYLFIGFVFGLWHPGWVIFPVVGILFGAFCAIVNAMSEE